MKRLLYVLLCMLLTSAHVIAQGFPTVSTDDETKWYLIQFMNGGNVLTAETDGANITTSAAIGSDAQLWKLSGSSSLGYFFTNKKGYTLSVASAEKNQMVRATSTITGTYRFAINKTTASGYSGGYEIQPKSNTSISMNLWGGPAENRGVGLWDKADQNNAVKFVDAAHFEQLGKIGLIPFPNELETKDGELALSSLSAIAYTGEQMKEHVEAFANQLSISTGITLEIKEAGDTPSKGEVWFGIDESLYNEAYTMSIGTENICVKASGFAGWFYALQTLTQLLPREYFAEEKQSGADAWSIHCMEIADRPHLGHRGYMLDIARHFFNKNEVKKILDIMAMYKLNRFHWHLTDDQGWRIEIPEYPKLTEVGAIRKGSFANNGDGQKFFDDTEYGRGMYYTLDDLREIVAYAKARNIEIIPEVDLPGHMVAAVASYPEFSCDSTKKYEVRIDGGISHDVLNIGDDRVIDFLKCVLGHVAEVFPYDYVHLGGDECPTEQWATNQQCLDRVKELGLAGVHQLQSWLVEELGIFLKENYGKDIVVWDELLANWNDNNKTKPIIMAWNGLGYSSQAANRGLKSIIVPYQYLYIDFMQAEESGCFVDEIYHGGWGVNTVEEIYGLNPLSALSGKEDYALGVQANMWTETCNDIDEVEYCLLPRMLALSEIAWLPTSKKDWTSFYRRLQSHDEIFDLLDYQYAKHYIQPKEYTEQEQTILEAKELLKNSIRGGVGYPSAEVYDALQSALDATDGEDVSALADAVANYKSADIVQPQEGKTYQIISASTYYKRQYEGSTMYQKGNGVRFHFTPQTEPEELWQFVATDGGYVLKNLCSGKFVKMGSYNTALQMVESNGTPIRMDKATIATKDFTYIPGVVTLSAVSGYSAQMTGNVKRFSAELSGDVYAKDEAALCYNGTWKLVEITDFSAQLQGLVNKCELILLTAKPNEMGNYTQEALDFAEQSIIIPAQSALAEGVVTEEKYNEFLALYNQFMQMPKVSISQSLSEECYYYIRNVWFGRYANYNSSDKSIGISSSKGSTDNYLWRIKKNTDGTVVIYNKKTQTGAYLTSNAVDQKVKVGQDYSWTLEERTLDGKSGVCIIDGNGVASWYTNPDVWNYVLMKPFWGACTWEFVESGIEVPTGISNVLDNAEKKSAIYNLNGTRVLNPTKGVYITDGKVQIIK